MKNNNSKVSKRNFSSKSVVPCYTEWHLADSLQKITGTSFFCRLMISISGRVSLDYIWVSYLPLSILTSLAIITHLVNKAFTVL